MAYVVVAYPGFNSEEDIGSIVLKTRKRFENVLVVDDGSRDETSLVARMAGAQVVTHPRTLGKEAILHSMLSVMRRERPDAFAIHDGNGECRPDDVLDVLDPVLKGKADIVRAPQTGFSAYSGSLLAYLVVQDSAVSFDAPRSGDFKEVKVLDLKKDNPGPRQDETRQRPVFLLMTIVGFILLILGAVLAALTLWRVASGILIIDAALLSVAIMIVGAFSIILGRRSMKSLNLGKAGYRRDARTRGLRQN